MTVAEVAGSRSEHFSMRTFRARPRNLKEPEKLFVGKLLPEATEEPKHARRSESLVQDQIRDAFRRLGEVKVQLIKDRETGESRGFGFITFPDASKAEEAWCVALDAFSKGRGARPIGTGRELRSAGKAAVSSDPGRSRKRVAGAAATHDRRAAGGIGAPGRAVDRIERTTAGVEP